MKFYFSTRSRDELEGVHPELVRLVEAAIANTPVDFSVHDGLRTVEEQRRLVATGASQTMNSMHLAQADGFGHAVDLVPYINGRMRWEWGPIYTIAQVMQEQAETLGIPIIWGGCWHRLDGMTYTPRKLMQAYIEKRRGQCRRPFCDGPHFQLAR